VKILYINELLNSSSGSSIHGRKLTEKLKLLDVSLLTIPAINNEKSIKFRSNFIKTFMLNMPSAISEIIRFIKQNLKSFFSLLEIHFVIKSFKPDCILIRTELYDLKPILLKKISKIPIVLEVNAPFFLEKKIHYEARNKNLIIPSFLSKLDLKIWKSADAIYVVSNILKKIVKSQLGNESPFIEVIPNGVDSDYLDKLPTEFSNGKSSDIRIGFAGSLQFWHGCELLLEAYEEIAKLRPATKLIFIGDGENRKNLEHYVYYNKNLKERVIFTGKLTYANTMEILKKMDILVAPYKVSKYFYFSSLKIFDYMASGKAIIASKLGQINEILEHDVDAILINPENKEEFCNALLTLIDSGEKRFKLGNMAFHKAKNYTWGKSAKSLLDLVQKIVTEKMYCA